MCLELTIFEDLAIADKEKIHTQVLNHVLNNKNITTASKIAVLCKIVDSNDLFKDITIDQIAITAMTECSNIDLQIDIKSAEILIAKFVFENKLKSSLHSDQLTKYSSIINENPDYKEKAHFIFLTLAGESGQAPWKSLSFENYACAFKLFELADMYNGNLNVYLEDYKKMLNNLIESYKWFTDNPKLYPITSKAKLTQNIIEVKTYNDYIRKFQLSTIFTKNYYLTALSSIKDKPWMYIEIEETHGNSLFNLILYEYNYGKEDQARLFLQAQNGTIKLAFALKDFKGKKNVINDYKINDVFNEFSSNEYKGCRFNKPRVNGYISISIGKYQGDDLANLGVEIMHVFNEHKSNIDKLNNEIASRLNLVKQNNE